MGTTKNSKFVDYYKLLNVLPSADIIQIRRAYIEEAKQHHPDAGGSTETMQLLNMAYRTLMHTSSKGAYDLLHNFHTGATEVSQYKYDDRRAVRGVNDMSDSEIDSFLDTVLAEYRKDAPKTKLTMKERLKKILEP